MFTRITLWWILWCTAHILPSGLLPSFSQLLEAGRLSTHGCVPFCGLKKAPRPKDMPLPRGSPHPMTEQWRRTKDHPSFTASMGSADASVAIASEFNFTFCPALLPSLPPRCWSQGHPPINFVHANLHLSVGFLGNPVCDTLCNVESCTGRGEAGG